MNKDVVRLIERYGWNYRVLKNNDKYRKMYKYQEECYMGWNGQGLMFVDTYMYAFNYRPDGFCNKICHFERETQYDLSKNYW